MRISNFFKSSWVLQLVVGVGLFLCSFFFEYRVLRAFISPQLMALFLAITLETGKVTAIVWHYYLDYLSSHQYPGSVRMTSTVFRLGLVVLSLICSLLFLTARLDRPNLETVKQAEISAIDQRLKEELEQRKQRYSDQKRSMELRHQSENTGLNQRYAERVEQLEALLLKEMDNVVRGIFKGARYEEFERRLIREKSSWKTAVDHLQERHVSQLARLESDFNTALNTARLRADKERQQVVSADFSNDDRVNDPHIVAFLKVARSLFHSTMQPLQFVFLFSLLLSLLMEAGIMLAFSTVTVAMAPVLKTLHEEEMEKETLRAKVSARASREDIRHDAAINRIFKAGKRTVEAAGSRTFHPDHASAMPGAG